MSKRIVVDLFAGTGVGCAIQELGATEYGVELMEAAVATRAANGMETIYGDVWDAHLLADKIMRSDADAFINHTLWASPPCQTFSQAGSGAGVKALKDVLKVIHGKKYLDMAELKAESKLLGDERIGLVLSPLHYAARFRPMFIAFEQVTPVLPVWEAMAVELQELGYSTWTGIVHAEQYGVPQQRKRAVLIARRDGGIAKLPSPTHSKYYNRNPSQLDAGVKRWVSMADALGWGYVNRPSNTVCGVSSHAVGDSEWGGAPARKALRDAADSGDAASWMPNASGAGRKANGNVCVTPEESAALQTYPDCFVFSGTRTQRFLQVGNAVPRLLAKAILEELWTKPVGTMTLEQAA